MTLAKNIRYLRKKNRWSQDDLANKLGYKSFTTIQKWESGVADPPFKTLKELAELFAVDMDDLANLDMETDQRIVAATRPTDSDGVLIPVYGHVAAGEPIDANQDIVGYEKIDPDLARRGDFYALVIKGDSMYPDIQDGDTIIVRAQPDAENKQIVVATVNGDDATCKKLYKLPGGGIQLHSINPTYEPFTFSEGDISSIPVRILGVVMEMRRRYE